MMNSDNQEKRDRTEVVPLPIHRKLALTIRKAAEYGNIGIDEIDWLLRQRDCPFVLYIGSKKLVKRKEFEAFVSNSFAI